jgi:hypothetical protein
MRQHMAGLLQAEGFVQCAEQQRLGELLRDTVSRHGSTDVADDYTLLRALLMGAVYAMVLPNLPPPLTLLRGELFQRYGLDWESGVPPGPEGPGRMCAGDLSRFFLTDGRGTDRADGPSGAEQPE